MELTADAHRQHLHWVCFIVELVHCGLTVFQLMLGADGKCDISAADALCGSGLARSSKRARQKLLYT